MRGFEPHCSDDYRWSDDSKAELCRMDDVMGNTTISTAEDIRRRLIDFTSARVSMINVYNSFLVENFGLPNELTALTTVLSSVEHLLMLLINHESLTSLFTFIVNEIVTMKLLLEVQLALIRCEFLQSLIKLKSAHVRLRLWFSSVGYKHAQNKGTVKMEPLSILLIADRCNAPDISPRLFYHLLLLVMAVLQILMLGKVNCEKIFNLSKNRWWSKEVNVLLPSISILIQEAATKKFGTDRITYCHDQLISKSFFVLPVEYNLYITVIFNRRVSERDNTVVDMLDRRQCNLQSIPHDIDRNARTLEEMYLDCNHIKDLDKPLFRCRKLKILSLSENEVIRLPSDIAYLTYLEELNLKGNGKLPPTITQLTSMTSLGLNDISLTQMPHDIGQLRNLRSLEVRENLLRTVPSSISQLNQLRRLDLGHNELDDLPNELGMLENLEELYVDQNDLEALPESIVQCRSLEQLDVSENKLMVLPDEIGDLEKLDDLTVAQNCLQILPSRLKRLSMLKADRNAITQLTPAIGSCHALTEIYLTENLLTEIPSSLGNLKSLRTLNLDKNQLKELPPTIGGCTSLSVLSLRDNLLEQLPLEIGRLENLRVLDVCNNRLNYLPFTVNVLFKLRALWLSENQSQAMLKLQTEQDPRTGIKVLTCYLLPQSNSQLVEQTPPNRSFIGGPKVHFGSDLEETHEDEENEVGQFSRHDTPHPKPHSHAPKFKKQSIDGHIIHHDNDVSLIVYRFLYLGSVLPSKRELEPLFSGSIAVCCLHPSEQSTKPPILTLNSGRKRDPDECSPRTMSPAEPAATQIVSLRSALKHPPVLPSAASFDHNVDRIVDQRQKLSPGVEILNIKINRDANGGLGLSIAGGLESTPYKDDDTGLFVSKLTDGGPAMIAGLRVGDKLLRVNKTDVVNVRHQVAVTSMQDARDIVELTVLRDSREIPSSYTAYTGYTISPNQSIDNSFVSESIEASSSMIKETISTTIRRDVNGSPGFSVASGTGDVIVISCITSGGAAERDGKLRVGDRVLSGARHDQAVALLTGHSANDIYLVVQRDHGNQNITMASSSPSLSSTKIHADEQILKSTVSVILLGMEVELVRDSHSLGLSIVGGSDHSSHPFGINAPGVFISKITLNSPAGRSQRLRIGDRILSVNNINIRSAKHQTAVEALKQSDRIVRLLVIHEPQPPGLRQVTIKRNIGEALGLNICGGIGSPPANPFDKTDEGIFIEKVERSGPAAASSLSVGTRILEVNDESLLGCSQEEAARVLRQSGCIVRLLVCDAFYVPSATVFPSFINQSCNEKQVVADECETTISNTLNNSSSQPCKLLSPPDTGATETIRTVASISTDNPLAASSPIPPVSSSSAVEATFIVLNSSHSYLKILSYYYSSDANCIEIRISFAYRRISYFHSQIPGTFISVEFTTAFISVLSSNTTTFSTSSLRPALPPPIAPKPRIITNQKQPITSQNGNAIGASSPLTSFDEQFEKQKEYTISSAQSSSPSTSSWSSIPNPERLAFSSKLEKFEREIEIKGQMLTPRQNSPTLPSYRMPAYNVKRSWPSTYIAVISVGILLL
ncbi:Leucine-rich repeat-containing protein 1 [Dirofilaria immitis]|nr:Leucine-rich repeat-containing protein 1 [Dirofilaria immitis]